jgi:hypothetical protein
MKLVKQLLSIATLTMVAGSTMWAAPINGSLPFVSFTVTQNAGQITASTVYDSALTLSDTGAGDFSTVTLGTFYGDPLPGGFHLDLNNLASFQLVSAAFGEFQADSGTILARSCVANTLPGQESCALDVYLLGNYFNLPTFDDTDASMRVSINQSGASLSAAITLTSPALPQPPPAVPEPATMALCGGALLAVAGIRRRTAKQ